MRQFVFFALVCLGCAYAEVFTDRLSLDVIPNSEVNEDDLKLSMAAAPSEVRASVPRYRRDLFSHSSEEYWYRERYGNHPISFWKRLLYAILS